MKMIMASVLALILLLTGIAPYTALAEGKKVSVVTTIFPLYDWVREITAGNDNVEIIMLLDSGADLHNYQPTAQDILKIASADLFVFVGGESDDWVEDVLETARNDQLVSVNLVEAMGDAIKMEEIVEGMEHDEHDHDDHDEDHDDHDEEEDHDHEEEADEHIWLSLRNAQALSRVIAEKLAQIDPDNASLYQSNFEAYHEKLAQLDAAYAEAVNAAAYKTVLFGDRFPFRYLADDYGLSYYAAFSGCSAETEASFQTILFLAQKVDELNLPAVLTIEQPKARIAETIVSATKNKNQKILAMNSLQSVTSQGVQAGITYLSAMEENLAVLKDALSD
ncbi:MAG: metal ABC transporter substrate-binding protein [Clostridia bacterium]|nr:metal ABC transporter substrate-binding protein [Clostridia bacterium]